MRPAGWQGREGADQERDHRTRPAVPHVNGFQGVWGAGPNCRPLASPSHRSRDRGKPRQGNVHVPKTCPPLKMDAGQPAPWRYGADLWAASGASRSPQPPPTSSFYQEREDSNFEECSQTPTGVGVRRLHGHFLGCCQSARRPSLGPGPRWRSGPLLTCLSLSAAIRGCLSWSCFLRSPFYGDTEEWAQPGRPGVGGGR